MHWCKTVGTWWVAVSCSFGAERINHEGRILGPAPTVSAPILFNTAQADEVVSAMQIMPRESAWNEDISRRPLLANSDAMIAQIITDLRSDRRMLRAFHEMNFVLVPDTQPLVPIDFIYYADESDPSPYPIPTNLPVETWPSETGGLSLSDWQRDVNDTGGDRHSIMVMPGAGFGWETWVTRLTASGWEAGNGAKFDLKSNTLRPFGWTSGDAAGLPMFPALVRYDECMRGMVEHAMRIVVRRTRLGPIYPATHSASVGSLTDPNIPAMGQRVRLKASFVIPENWTIFEKAVLRGLKKYGAMVADNGNFFSISVTPDDRYPVGAFSHLSSIAITNFEVVQTTGANEGPRSPGAPIAEAGADLSATPRTALTLNGTVQTSSGTGPVVTEWKLYSGPGLAQFSDATRTNMTVSFDANGEYILMLKATDGIHAPSYDTVRVRVSDGFTVSVRKERTLVRLDWADSGGSYAVETTDDLSKSWGLSVAVPGTDFVVPELTGQRFFRVRRDP
jgi:hypothetical protein